MSSSVAAYGGSGKNFKGLLTQPASALEIKQRLLRIEANMGTIYSLPVKAS